MRCGWCIAAITETAASRAVHDRRADDHLRDLEPLRELNRLVDQPIGALALFQAHPLEVFYRTSLQLAAYYPLSQGCQICTVHHMLFMS